MEKNDTYSQETLFYETGMIGNLQPPEPKMGRQFIKLSNIYYKLQSQEEIWKIGTVYIFDFRENDKFIILDN